MIPTPSKLSQVMQVVIVSTLLAMFAAMAFIPLFKPEAKVDADVRQTLINFLSIGVAFFFGKNVGSAERDAAITAAAIGTPTVPPVVKIDDRQPVQVQDAPVDPAQMGPDGRRRQL